ncbi:helix-turn-helix domain-containing protein [Aquimarina sediminis]|uniref:helix-turn-helix domain-containing protein n=1 Tax=Aquimarina sediminis TaxID=2070536 RepID=UPI000CA04E8D|nr:helix-turn-helix domain-containing protein [Aquimarina sediminis]
MSSRLLFALPYFLFFYIHIIISILLAISLFGVIYYYRYYRKKQKLIQIFNKIPKQDFKKEPPTISESCPINQKTLSNLLKRLQQFEEKKEYLKPNLNTKDLAKSFGSNSSYLSKAVNTYKEKSFSNYINDLRIDYVIDKLRKDAIFRKYKIKAIAQEVGFNNSEAFSKAFYKKAGIYPSSFIKQLEKDKTYTKLHSGNTSHQKSK